MKTKIFLLSLPVFAVLLFAACAVSPDRVAQYAKASGNDIGRSAEELTNLAEKGELTAQQADKILAVLQPRLLNMSQRVLRGKAHSSMYSSELRLAWLLVAHNLISAFEAETLVKMLDTSWCRYEKELSSSAARIELHGRIMSPLQGMVLHHKVWIPREGGTPLLGVEGFVCNRSEGTASVSWGLEDSTEVDIEKRKSLPLMKETVVYLVAAKLLKGLPVRADKPAQMEAYRRVISDENTQELCSVEQRTVLTEDNDWRNNFDSKHPNQ